MRQHSTPRWIQRLQETGLERLADGERKDGLPSFATQRMVLNHYRCELQRLKRGEISLSELVITRRTSRSLADYRVKNVTYAALMRANERGYEVPPGGKVRYVVMNRAAEAVLERVVLAEELDGMVEGAHACVEHYAELAERAIWALLAPFGWTTEQLRNDGRQPTLFSFNARYGACLLYTSPSPRD